MHTITTPPSQPENAPAEPAPTQAVVPWVNLPAETCCLTAPLLAIVLPGDGPRSPCRDHLAPLVVTSSRVVADELHRLGTAADQSPATRDTFRHTVSEAEARVDIDRASPTSSTAASAPWEE